MFANCFGFWGTKPLSPAVGLPSTYHLGYSRPSPPPYPQMKIPGPATDHYYFNAYVCSIDSTPPAGQTYLQRIVITSPQGWRSDMQYFRQPVS